MQQFADAREAKEFLVERILSQAERDGVSLSEIERKMLYFSETAWTLPDIMEVNEEFDRRYDQDEYEQKIAQLVRSIRSGAARDEGGRQNWDRAVPALRNEDHYLLVLIDAGAGRTFGDVAKLILTALLIASALIAAMVRFRPHKG